MKVIGTGVMPGLFAIVELFDGSHTFGLSAIVGGGEGNLQGLASGCGWGLTWGAVVGENSNWTWGGVLGEGGWILTGDADGDRGMPMWMIGGVGEQRGRFRRCRRRIGALSTSGVFI